MSRLTDRLERDLREVAAGAQPSPSAWESILARLGDDAEPEVARVLAPASAPSRRPVWLAVAAAALVVIVGSVAVLSRAGDDESISFATSDLTATFVSPRNGFSVKHPEGADVTPATQLWAFSGRNDDGYDVVKLGSGAVFRGTSTDSLSVDETADEYLLSEYVLPGACGVPRSQQAEITIDGQSGRIAECSNHIEATVVVRSQVQELPGSTAGRLYLFTLSHDRSDARAVFDALVATIDLTPQTANDLPADTVESPTYGYSFPWSRGGFEPATEGWDPSSQPVDDIGYDPRFDAFETGYGAYFVAASTPIPDGVSIDEWVDEYITPVAADGCGLPRSQQAEITIDGQPGRLAECDHTEVTVVAGGRLYRFIGLGDRSRFDAWIATIDLTPETAADT
jgi:hypothetical protein